MNYREMLLEMVDEGGFDPRDCVIMLVKWMSQDEVRECMEDNSLLDDEDDV